MRAPGRSRPSPDPNAAAAPPSTRVPTALAPRPSTFRARARSSISTPPYGHHGRSVHLREVILRHVGGAQAAGNAFVALFSVPTNAESRTSEPSDPHGAGREPGVQRCIERYVAGRLGIEEEERLRHALGIEALVDEIDLAVLEGAGHLQLFAQA